MLGFQKIIIRATADEPKQVNIEPLAEEFHLTGGAELVIEADEETVFMEFMGIDTDRDGVIWLTFSTSDIEVKLNGKSVWP